MPRLSRTVFAGIPHHVTQRGNRRENVFFCDDDYISYLAWLKEYAGKHSVEILAYCLMTNHIHLVALPMSDDGLQRMLKPVHMRYAQRINRAQGWAGHLWQGRFFSSPLDEAYLWAAVRYVERNPVRAGMTQRAEDYRWSSAAAHGGHRVDELLNPACGLNRQFSAVDDWSAWLSEGDETEELQILRRNVDKGLPCGAENFVTKLSKIAGRTLEYRPQGRPVRVVDEDKG